MQNQAHSLKPLKAVAPKPVKIARALISVFDKDGLGPLAEALQKHGVHILSTGGTAKFLQQTGASVTDVSAYTGFPEIMGGRVKTLHPKVHGGLLARRDEDGHLDAMTQNGIDPIDLLIVNLYPFADVVAKGADFETVIENIDIGGPAMIRAAAKNHDFVTVVTDPADYAQVIADLNAHDGAIPASLRRILAAKAFAATARYDSAIARWFEEQSPHADFPVNITFGGTRKQTLRYGENPHQKAAFYTDGSARPGIATAEQRQGKELSYNNLNDTDAAFELVAEFETPAVAIIKHANPCGVATDDSLFDAYHRALRCDPVSAFGGIIALNRALDAKTAEAIIKIFSEVIIAPSVDDDALALLSKKQNLRVLTTGAMPDPGQSRLLVKSLAGGLLVQGTDNGITTPSDLQIVTKRKPTAQEMADMLFAFRVAKHVKSNAIVYAKDGATVGIGAGQMSRVDSARIAALKSAEASKAAGIPPMVTGSVVASDAFFPFADGLITAAEAGATAVIQPGGSLRDDEVIEAANTRNLAMVMTGKRHFRH
jgi:phosphoribosylaminoimidazolecarboxamide formyltransferase/IMP cyclohydrolase